jgi:hypothetical protein
MWYYPSGVFNIWGTLYTLHSRRTPAVRSNIC